MKRVDDLAQLEELLSLASSEAAAAFGDDRVYLERFIGRGRHVEVQVLGDGAGKVIHLGDRDCSVQRRYQKLIEETPAPGLPQKLRDDLREAGVRFAKRLSYRGAGTVEFLVDTDRGAFYFLEMNARIQVEHPVTEAVSGIDLVEQQIAIAAGQGLALRQEDVRLAGAAIECRLNAEDPARDFAPSPGTVSEAVWPTGDGIRVDSHIESGSSVPPFYDSLMAKIIAHGATRAEALARLRQALEETQIVGVASNIAFHRRVVADPEFAVGGVDTGFLARFGAREAAELEA
jgi:acetyl-CoA carboxylase biotin carboxylase subunit